jgi:hypothetical protein
MIRSQPTDIYKNYKIYQEKFKNTVHFACTDLKNMYTLIVTLLITDIYRSET